MTEERPRNVWPTLGVIAAFVFLCGLVAFISIDFPFVD